MDIAALPTSHPTLQSQRSVCAWFISCCLHVSSVDFVCMHVDAVCFAHWLFSDGLVFTNNVLRSFDHSTVGWTLQRRRFRIQRCCLHPTLLPQLKGPFSRCSTPVLLLVGVLVFCVPIPTSHYSISQIAKEWDVDACALLTAWGGYGDVYTFLPCMFVVMLVGVFVFCVPIPTSHYSVPFSCSTFSLTALSWEKG